MQLDDAAISRRFAALSSRFAAIAPGDRVVVRFGDLVSEHRVAAVSVPIQTIDFAEGGGCTWFQVEEVRYANGDVWQTPGYSR